MKNTLHVFAISSLLFLNACGTSASKSAASVDEASSKFSGTYSYGAVCNALAYSGGHSSAAFHSYTYEIMITNSNYSEVYNFYSDSICQTPSSIVTLVRNIEFSSDDLSSGSNMNVTAGVSATILPLTSAAASELTTINSAHTGTYACNLTFSSGTATSILNRSCDFDVANSSFGRLGADYSKLIYEIVKIDSSVSPNQLYLGDASGSLDGSTEAKRPTTFPVYYMSKK